MLSINDLLQEFIYCSETRYELRSNPNPDWLMIERLAERQVAAQMKLIEMEDEGIDCLISLLDHPSDAVKLDSINISKKYQPQKAKEIISRLAGCTGPIGFEAGNHLRYWEKF